MFAVHSIDALVQALIFEGDGWSVEKLNTQGWVDSVQGSHLAYTWLNITGAGMLLHVQGHANDPNQTTLHVQIDGGAIQRLTVDGMTPRNLFIPFKTSLVVSSSTNVSADAYVSAVAVLN